MNALVVRFAFVNPKVERVFEGTTTVMIEDGRYVDKALHHEGLRRADVDAAIRRQVAGDESTVERATLGVGGSVVVEMKAEAQPATKADVAALAAAISRLEQRLA